MLLRDYEVTKVRRNLCNPEWILVSAELNDDISKVFPYLNAIVKNAVYTPEAQNLNFKMDAGAVSLMPRQMSVGQVTCEEDGIELLDYVKKLINDTWERRTSITPIYERKGEIKARDVLAFLPRTNCRDCELPTCFAFAVALLKGQKRLQDCPALSKPGFAQDKEALTRLLQIGISEEVAK